MMDYDLITEPQRADVDQFLARDIGRSALVAGELAQATVLMIDDEPTTLDIVQTFLEDAGYMNFVKSDRPGEAMALLERVQPAIVLLDLMMPGISGFDVLKQMRAHELWRFTPVLILTAAADSATKLKALEFGATDFLAKPVDPSELALRVRNALAFRVYQNRLAKLDSLTGLANRREFLSSVGKTLNDEATHSGIMLLVDIDRFRQVNDGLGQRAGDAMLVEVARRLAKALPRARLARLGGDQFAALLPNVDVKLESIDAARAILDAFRRPFEINDQEIFATPSVGVAAYPEDGLSAEALIRHAELAMRQAKRNSGNGWEVYSTKLNNDANERMSLEAKLRRAVERNELVLHYQPKVDTATLRIKGVEALVRWNHPDLGMIAPVKFIGIAEETGLIGEIGAWVLEEACRQGKRWMDQGLPELSIAVNLSVTQFVRRLTLPSVSNALDKSGFTPHRLVLELTESILMENARDGEAALHALKELGTRLSVDDFGTGYSSLTYLRKFPIDEVKIDRSFVRGTPEAADNAAIVGAIIALARELNLSVCAEGVETTGELAFLRQRRCALFQGYLFSKPVPADQMTKMLQRAADKAQAEPATDPAPSEAIGV